MTTQAYIEPEMVIENKTAQEIEKLFNEVEQFMYREQCHGGSVKKLEKVYADFKKWKAENGFDERTDMEDISQALSDKM